MATNNGEQAHEWALTGILISRSAWDVQNELESGQLIQVLPDWKSEPAPIRMVFPTREFYLHALDYL